MRTKLSLFICLLLSFSAWSQIEKIDTKKGNDDYNSGRYEEAISGYTKALEKDPEYMEAIFNTGNALQQMSRRLQEQAQNAESEEEKKELMEGAITASDKAASQFASVAKMAKTNEEINKAQYNLGNARLMSGDLSASIKAYKEALRKVPGDEDARYNLAYAQYLKSKLTDEEKSDDNQDSEEDDNKDKNQPDDNQNKDQKNQDQQKPEDEQPQELSKEEAEQLLKALMKQEKDLQQELKKNDKNAQRVKIEKDW